MDPLAQLQDIQLPEEIHNYPIAIGWWGLVLIGAALIIFITIKIIKHKQQRRSQQHALHQLKADDPTIKHCVTTLKWAALQYFPRGNVANLYGENFHLFLLNALPLKHQENFKVLSGNTLQQMYQAITAEKDDQFYQATLLWLTHALPPKPLQTKNIQGENS